MFVVMLLIIEYGLGTLFVVVFPMLLQFGCCARIVTIINLNIVRIVSATVFIFSHIFIINVEINV